MILVILFTGIFNLANVNWIAFAVLFVILFITLDVFYSFSDVSYWGMVPALSEDSKERGDPDHHDQTSDQSDQLIGDRGC